MSVWLNFILGFIVVYLLFRENKNPTQIEIEKLEELKRDYERDKDYWEENLTELQNEFERERNRVKWQKQNAEKEVQEATQRAREEADKELKEIKKMKNTALKEYPHIAMMLADIQNQRNILLEKTLRYKRRPAIKAAEEVQKLRDENQRLAKDYYSCKWELEHLKKMLPQIEDIEEESTTPAEAPVRNPNFSGSDRVGYWLTPDEYSKLGTIEKNQLALDKYCQRHKSNLEIGREYERYIGYLCEKEGYKVEYFGIENGLEDLGRDLVCTNSKEIMIIQCKCWSNKKNKVIHEKHINQLYGTATMYKIQNKKSKKKVRAVFVSTVPCTDTAKEFADYLGVTFKQIPLEPYPMIKCNINAQTKEKIYHLPFDQQYDKCTIKKGTGEFYAMTVQEAEDNGFRRAMKWHGK